MLTEDQLRRIVPKMRDDRVAAYLPHLNDALAEFGIDSVLRTAAFVAQLAHESGSFVWMKELWGPTAAQQRYEPPGDLAQRLGNTQPGDGRRYMGRGPIQLTGRDNYRRFGRALGLDLEGNPDQAAQPAVGFRIAGLYWKNRDINTPADADDIREVTRRINGGFNGLADRTEFYERAKAVLAVGFVPNPVGRGAAAEAEVPGEPLDRGREPDAPPVWAEAAAPAPAAPAVAEVATPPAAPAAKKAPTKKAAAKKAAARKTPAKKVAAKKAAASKAPAKKAAAKKTAVKKAPAKKAATRRAPARKAAAKKVVPKKPAVKKPAAKKSPARKPAAAKKPAAKQRVARR